MSDNDQRINEMSVAALRSGVREALNDDNDQQSPPRPLRQAELAQTYTIVAGQEPDYRTVAELRAELVNKLEGVSRGKHDAAAPLRQRELRALLSRLHREDDD